MSLEESYGMLVLNKYGDVDSNKDNCNLCWLGKKVLGTVSANDEALNNFDDRYGKTWEALDSLVFTIYISMILNHSHQLCTIASTKPE